MRKGILLAAIAILLLITSCSSESASSLSKFVENPVKGQGTFNLKVDNSVINMSSWKAIRSENGFLITAYGTPQIDIYIRFNTAGDLGSIVFVTSYITRYSPFFSGSHFVNFNLVEIDEAKKTVKVNFSGKVYGDEIYSNEASQVEGSFEIPYTVVTPKVAGLGMSAKINGSAWNATKLSAAPTPPTYNELTTVHTNDQDYSIEISWPISTVDIGEYSFDNDSNDYKVILKKSTPTGDNNSCSIEKYLCKGKLIVTEVTEVSENIYISGTFNLTATKPDNSETITITDGVFKELYGY